MKKHHFSTHKFHLERFRGLLFCCLLCSVQITANAQFSGGSGTESDPYIITTAEQLVQMTKYLYASEYYKLGNDISLSGYVWRQIRVQRGHFDGDNHKITDLNQWALFSSISEGGTVKNLGLERVNVTRSNYSNDRVGGLAERLDDGSIINCYVTGTVSGNNVVGGVVGSSSSGGSIINCYSTANVSGNDYVGGVVGAGGIISNCYATGNVSGNNYVGGVVASLDGFNSNDAISNCYATGNVNGNNWVGGVVGNKYGAGSIISNCYATGNVSGNNYVGGVVGDGSGTSNCVALNPQVSGPLSDVGRVEGYGGASSNNIAFYGMLNNNGSYLSWSNIGLSLKDGANITTAEIHADGTLGGRFTAPVWTTQNGKLPGFGAAVDLPDHLKNAPPVITITTQPAATANVTQGSISGNLSVAANVTQGATLSYQWYRATTNSNIGGTAISGATSSTFAIPTTLTASGSPYYYFCEVRATDGAYSVRSNVATVNVAAPIPVITITTQPAAITNVTQGSISGSLSVVASVTQSATRNYQWYRNTTNSNEGGTAISGATSTTFAIPTTLMAAGSPYYYFCEVRATGGATSVRSSVAIVNVSAPIPVITITTQPAISSNVTQGAISGSLSVAANVTQGATLSYQWHSNTTNSNVGGTAISGATSATFAIPTTLTAAGSPYYYFCVVSATGGATSVRSNVATVNVSASSATPVITITTQPASTNVTQGSISGSLSVAANVTQSATLSYQWHSNTTNSNVGGTAISGATSSTFTIPSTLTVSGSPYYYFCVVSATGGATSVRSNVATVNVSTSSVTPVITITTQPTASSNVTQGAISGSLSVVANVTQSATLSYQWHSNTTNSNVGGTAISGATSSTFAIPSTLTAAGSPYYYFCVVSATGGATSVRSNVATVTVTPLTICPTPIASGTTGTLTWSLCPDGTLYVTGTGAIPDYNYSNSPWYSWRSSVSNVVVGNGVSSIGNYAFQGCNNLISATIPNSVTNMSTGTFQECSSLTSVTIPSSITILRPGVFAECSSLKSITIPGSVTTIQYYAFRNCSSLESIVIPNSVTRMEHGVFLGCNSLTSVTIPSLLTDIGIEAFSGCSKLAVIINHATTPQSIDANVFTGVNKTTCMLQVPANYVNTYRAADVWKEFLNIFEIGSVPDVIPVTSITGISAMVTAGTPLALNGTIVPSNATNKTITWSVQNAGTTGATISGNTLNTTTAGTVTMLATIVNGVAIGTNYTQDFTITVKTNPPVPVFDGLAKSYTAGSAAVPLKVIGTGSERLTIFKVNGATATQFNPSTAGVYIIEATSATGKLRIWRYVKVN